jgi:hypothetical protein
MITAKPISNAKKEAINALIPPMLIPDNTAPMPLPNNEENSRSMTMQQKNKIIRKGLFPISRGRH